MTETQQINLQIHLTESTPGALGGIQVGSGKTAKVPEWIQTDGSPVTFKTTAELRDGKLPLKGNVIQKDTKGRFVYIVWRSHDGVISRRAKLYLESITQDVLDSSKTLRAVFPGLAKDGLPCCATVKPIEDWRAVESPAT